jgi:hypothetical protein
VTFEFALPKGAALPVGGTIFHTGKNERIAIDLSALETLPIEAAPKTESSASVAPASDSAYEEKSRTEALALLVSKVSSFLR